MSRGGELGTDRPLVWVLVPTLETSDPSISAYYDFSKQHDEFQRAFAALEIAWRWQPVTLRDFRDVLRGIAAGRVSHTPIVFNLCDGDETNGFPGVSVIHELDSLGLMYTGSDARFYDVTTSKICMKQAFDRVGVPTAPWEVLRPDDRRAKGLFQRLGSPLILKPAVSAASMGLTTRSVVTNDAELQAQIAVLESGYHGWDLVGGGLFVERFVDGPEYTTFIVGSHDAPATRTVYPPVELVFHRQLPPNERFLSFDRLWEMYEQDSPMEGGADLWAYGAPPADLVEQIRDVSWAAYRAVGGVGYGRVDVRQDAETGALYVLEVNAQCGLSEDDRFTSIGAIRKIARLPYSRIVRRILDEAVARFAVGVSQQP